MKPIHSIWPGVMRLHTKLSAAQHSCNLTSCILRIALIHDDVTVCPSTLATCVFFIKHDTLLLTSPFPPLLTLDIFPFLLYPRTPHRLSTMTTLNCEYTYLKRPESVGTRFP